MNSKILVQELSAPGCIHCKEFKDFWLSIEKDWSDVEFQDISVTTPEGQELAQKHMIFSSPGIIINHELFSTGGVDKDKFIAKLKELTTS
jgi:thioredoxin 1